MLSLCFMMKSSLTSESIISLFIIIFLLKFIINYLLKKLTSYYNKQICNKNLILYYSLSFLYFFFVFYSNWTIMTYTIPALQEMIAICPSLARSRLKTLYIMSNLLPSQITRGYETEIRRVAIIMSMECYRSSTRVLNFVFKCPDDSSSFV